MGQITTIVVPDAAATPVNHTFSKVQATGETVVLEERSSASSLGYWLLSLVQRRPLAGQVSKFHRTTIRLTMPVTATEVINGVDSPKLLYTLHGSVEIKAPVEATTQNIKDIRKVMSGILNDASVVTAVEGRESVW